ncbi:unnamed protein product [Paramecium sonneborni]|uniref:Uncharacterized protein n=1 Tax=Paramecium sonneborni TaxID=65129 RepID=A0A8S1RGI3_9CILI|nr:unnamed protein product [Paramecium sonneborni]
MKIQKSLFTIPFKIRLLLLNKLRSEEMYSLYSMAYITI